MKILITAIVHAATAMIAWAAPAGLCLHSYSPLAPPDKIECFEYLKFEKAGEDYRFFLHPNGSTIVPKIRYRGVIAYADRLNPGDPKFDVLLALLEKTTLESPATRRFLNQRVLSMRALAAAHAKIKKEGDGDKIAITLEDGTTLNDCRASRIEDGKVVIVHKEGIAKVEIGRLSDKDKISLGLAKLEKRQREEEQVREEDRQKLSKNAADRKKPGEEEAREKVEQKPAMNTADRKKAEEELVKLRKLVGVLTEINIDRKLDFEDFPNFRVYGSEIYQVSFPSIPDHPSWGSIVTGIVVTTDTSFKSGGKASLYLQKVEVIDAKMTNGFDQKVPVYKQSRTADVRRAFELNRILGKYNE